MYICRKLKTKEILPPLIFVQIGENDNDVEKSKELTKDEIMEVFFSLGPDFFTTYNGCFFYKN